MFNLSLLLNTGKIYALLSDRGKSTWAKDLFFVFESIWAKVMTFGNWDTGGSCKKQSRGAVEGIGALVGGLQEAVTR